MRPLCVCSKSAWLCVVREVNSGQKFAAWLHVYTHMYTHREAMRISKVAAVSAGRQSENYPYICMNLFLCLCVSTSLSPANSVVRNKRPQMMRPAGSHSTYHALRGQTVELECIVQGLWVSVCIYVRVLFPSIRKLTSSDQSYLPLIQLSPLLLPPHPLFVLLSILCCLLPTLLPAAISFFFPAPCMPLSLSLPAFFFMSTSCHFQPLSHTHIAVFSSLF